MEYARQLAYKPASFDNGYSILYEAHEASQAGKWMGSYKVRKGARVVADIAVANTYDSEREAEENMYRLAVDAMEAHAAGAE